MDDAVTTRSPTPSAAPVTHHSPRPSVALRQEHEYVSTFPAGWASVVRTCLAEDVGHLAVEHQDDSAIVYRGTATASSISELPYVKNSFAVLARTPRRSLDRAAITLARRISAGALPRRAVGGMRSFRLVAQMDGQLTPLGHQARRRLEDAVVRHTGATVNARGGTGDELWLIARRGLGEILFARRVRRAKRSAAPGTVAGELSHLLVRLSTPRPADIFLDPFAGSGAIARARLATPVASVVCADLLGAPLPEQADVSLARSIVWLQEDARTLPSVASGSIDVIVTDPPWGEHGPLDSPADEFFDQVATSLVRVLDPHHGRLVMLVARRIEDVVGDALVASGLSPSQRLGVLVNGHPATVVCATRGP